MVVHIDNWRSASKLNDITFYGRIVLMVTFTASLASLAPNFPALCGPSSASCEVSIAVSYQDDDLVT